MLRHIEGRKPGHVRRHLVDGESDVVELPLLPGLSPRAAHPRSSLRGVGLVLLGHAHHHVALHVVGAGDLDVELGVHGGRVWKKKMDVRFL